MIKKGEGGPVAFVNAMAATLRRSFRKSLIFSALCGYFCHFEERFYAKKDQNFPAKRRFLKEQEEGLVPVLLRRLLCYFGESALSSMALISFFFGGMLFISKCISAFFDGGAVLSGISLFSALLPVFFSFPFLRRKQSLAYYIMNSALFSSLIRFCNLEDRINKLHAKGRVRRFSPFVLAAFLFLWSTRLSVLLLPLFLLFFAIAVFLFLVPELCFALLLAVFPFLSLFQNPTLLLASLVAFCDLSYLWKVIAGKRELRFFIIDRAVLLLMALYACSGIFSPGGMGAISEGLIRAFLLTLYFPAVSFFSQALWRSRFNAFLHFGGALCSLYGIWQYFFSDMELQWTDPVRFADIGSRVTGFFQNPNILAVYLLLLLPFSFWGMIERKYPQKHRIFCFFAFVLEGLCLILTWTRGAWIGAIFSLLIFLLVYSEGSLAYALCLPLPAAAAVSFLPRSIIHRFGSILSFGESSIRYRLYTWKGVTKMLSAHPFGIGVGEEAFHAIYPAFAVSGTENVPHTHQLFFEIFAGLGIAGALLLLFFFLWIFLQFITVCRLAKGEIRGAQLAAFAGIIGTFIMGFFDYIWYHKGIFCLFFIIIAMLYTGEKIWKK